MGKINVLAACTTAMLCAAAHSKEYNLNADWRFSWAQTPYPLKSAMAGMEQGGIGVASPKYDDSGWELVSVPHPVNAHDTFDEHAVDAGENSYRRGMMFYRKRFTMPMAGGSQFNATSGKAFLTFETVRQTLYVWVNGKSTARRYAPGFAMLRTTPTKAA